MKLLNKFWPWKEIKDLKDSQMRLVDALKACKERNGEPTN
jgi:hypothetical protein